MAQNWHDLLFANAASCARNAKLLETLELDLYDGQAWISIVPFTMSGVSCATLAAPCFLHLES
jgi:uncharacterized protein YqjF (DUF2071 family)